MNREDMDELIRAAYGAWKAEGESPGEHPDDQALACLAEGKLSDGESELLKRHLLACRRCAQAFAVGLSLTDDQAQAVPGALVEKAKNLVGPDRPADLTKILLRLKDKAIEIISTGADVLVGQELVPAPVLRSRKIKDFKDEVTFLRDFQDLRVQLKLESKSNGVCTLSVFIQDKATLQAVKDLRVTLIREDTELESYLSLAGRAVFESVELGSYSVEISSPEKKIASILLGLTV